MATPTYQQNKKSAKKYLSQFDHITLRMHKDSGLKEQIQVHAEMCGEPVNTYILRAIEARMHGQVAKALVLDGDSVSKIAGQLIEYSEK